MEYMAPEIFLCDAEARARARREKVSLYGKEVDCWAIGVLAYECLFGRTPWEFDGASHEDCARRILAQGVSFDDDPPSASVNDEGVEQRRSRSRRRVISSEAKDFISSCLVFDPASRLTVQQMLWHPWITRGIVQADAKRKGKRETESTSGGARGATNADDAVGPGSETSRAAVPSDTTGGPHRQRPSPFRSNTFNVLSSSSRFTGEDTAQQQQHHGEADNVRAKKDIFVMRRGETIVEEIRKDRSKNGKKGEEERIHEKPHRSRSLTALMVRKARNLFGNLL